MSQNDNNEGAYILVAFAFIAMVAFTAIMIGLPFLVCSKLSEYLKPYHAFKAWVSFGILGGITAVTTFVLTDFNTIPNDEQFLTFVILLAVSAWVGVLGFLHHGLTKGNLWINIRAVNGWYEEQPEHHSTFPPHMNFGNDSDFDYQASAFAGKKSRKAASPSVPIAPPNAPYGWDKRHPDDVKLWAKVDDPSSTPAERKAAFNAILRAEERRKGQTGNSGVQRIA